MSSETKKNTVKLNRLLKDKVFHDLFYNKINLTNFCNEYLDLSKPITENELKILSTSDTLTDSLRSDLIFQVGDEYIGVVEAMSSSLKKSDFVFFLAYFFKTFYDYVVKHNEEIRAAKEEDLVLPKFRIFVLYSGNKKVKNKYIYSDVFAFYPIELNLIIEIITPNDDIIGNLTNQFLLFSQFESNFVKGKGNNLYFSKKEVNEFIDSMIDKGILKDYLSKNRGELMNMFEELHNEQRYKEFLIKQNLEKGKAIGLKEGKELGKKENSKIVIKNLLSLKIPKNQIAQVVDLPEDEVVNIIEELQS